MNKISFWANMIFLILLFPIHSSEIDQLTHREVYQENCIDFTEQLNAQTDKLISKALSNYNNKYKNMVLSKEEIHSLVAFEIFKVTAGSEINKFEDIIPENLDFIYAALYKSGLGPLQEWIMDDKKNMATIYPKNNFFSEIFPDSFNKNVIILVNGEFIGSDKIDHFFDQGYTYWQKSNYGNDEQKAIEFGIGSELGWYGILAAGVFSFGDLRANWGGYQFYKNLFSGETPLLSIVDDNSIKQNRMYDWANFIDWEYDEMKNPSLFSDDMYEKIFHYINHYSARYKTTYNYLIKKKIETKKSDYYLSKDLNLCEKDIYSILRSLFETK